MSLRDITREEWEAYDWHDARAHGKEAAVVCVPGIDNGSS